MALDHLFCSGEGSIRGSLDWEFGSGTKARDETIVSEREEEERISTLPAAAAAMM